MANLYGTLSGARGTTSRTGTDLLRARLATWHAAIVVELDDLGSWTVHTEPADPQDAACLVPVIVAAGNLHVPASTYDPGMIAAYRERRANDALRPNRSPARRPGPAWQPYREEPAR